MAIPGLSDLKFDGVAKIKGLPAAAANGEALIWEQRSSFAGADGTPGIAYRSGSDITISIGQAQPSTSAQIANALRVFPWRVLKSVAVTAIRIEVATLLAGSTFRLGLYLDNGSGYPSTLIANSDAGAFDGATAGTKSFTFASAITLAPGLYWLAVNNSATPTLRAIQASVIDPVLGYNPASGTTGNYTCLSASVAFAALPSTFPVGAAPMGNVLAPAAMFRVQ